MTIVTKPLSDKKQDQLKKPLVAAGELPQCESTIVDCPGEPNFILPTRPRASTHTIVCLFLISLAVLGIGVLGGLYLYRHLGRVQTHRVKGWFQIPNAEKDLIPQADRLFQTYGDDLRINDATNKRRNKIIEEFEIDTESEFEKINVPDFGIGRRGRFIHDFHANKTGIVDVDAGRCFVMPLNRARVLPPRNMFDLISKIWDGYYEVDTEIVREFYRVEIPPMTNVDEMGVFIFRECAGLPTYRLSRVPGRIFKRGLSKSETFLEFAGNKMTQFEINTDRISEYEKNNKIET